MSAEASGGLIIWTIHCFVLSISLFLPAVVPDKVPTVGTSLGYLHLSISHIPFRHFIGKSLSVM